MTGEAIAVRTFQGEDEISGLDGFQPDNPVSKDNYSRLLGDYHLSEKVRCCIRSRSGGLCKRPHNYGFVVGLKDGSVSIIGNICGKGHFDAESQVRKDMALYANAKRKQETLQRLALLLQSKDASMQQVKLMREALLQSNARVQDFRAQLGDACTSQLLIMSRGGGGAVIVMGERLRLDEDGVRRSSQQDRFAIPVGTLRGLAIFRPGHYRTIQDELRNVALAFGRAEQLDDSATVANLARIAGDIADLPRVLELGEALMSAEADFNASDWTPLPFLVRGLSDRYKLARIACSHAGLPTGKEHAKGWLQALEKSLKSKHGVDRLQIAY